MRQTASLFKLVNGNKHYGWIYRIWANPGRPWGGIVPPFPVLAPESALGSRPRVALSSAQVSSVYLTGLWPGNFFLLGLGSPFRRWPSPASLSERPRWLPHDQPVCPPV